MPGLLGKKIGMPSVFSAAGKNLPCTVIEVGPCVVTQIKTLEKDGYEAVQLGFGRIICTDIERSGGAYCITSTAFG